MLVLTDVKKPAPATTAVAAAVAIIFIASIPLAWSKELLGPRECEDLGFTGLALCSDCNTLAEYIKDQGDAFDSDSRPHGFSILDSFSVFEFMFLRKCAILSVSILDFSLIWILDFQITLL